MNRKKLLNHIIEILTAERDGIEIEYLPIECATWMKVSAVDTENLIKHHDRYRIKPPEPKLRPWKPEEVPLNAIFRYPSTGVITAGFNLAQSGVRLCNDTEYNRRTFQDLLSNYDHSTDGGKNWKPCGIEE